MCDTKTTVRITTSEQKTVEMDRQYVIDHSVVDRYLAGKLADDELTAFEEHCLWCQETLDDLELTDKFRQGLADAATADDRFSGDLIEDQPRSFQLPQFMQTPVYAAAATALLAVSVTTSAVLFLNQDTSTDGLASMQVYQLETLRSGSSDPANTVHIGESVESVVLIVYPEFGAYEHYRASVLPIDAEIVVWQDDDISVGTDTLALVLPTELLQPGDYRVRVEGLMSSDEPALLSENSFRVVTSASQ